MGPEWTLRRRAPGHVAIERCLERQAAARPRSALTRLLGASPLHPDAAPWFERALIARDTARALEPLGDDWRVLHAVPLAGRETALYHLAIGPGGVFAIHVAPVPEVERMALVTGLRLSAALHAPVEVVPVAVVPRELWAAPAPDPAGRSGPVVHCAELAAWLEGRPPRLGAAKALRVARIAEEWTTWRPGTSSPPADPTPVARFEALEREVRRAAARRVAWQVGGGTAAILLLALAVAFAKG